ncbi:hypothetical protein FRB94_009670 [Tulasnella sp. JGI-2019a]|nr:hypothetical protein FRB94_009670 [Tulasnella sp. JGI-2019a]
MTVVAEESTPSSQDGPAAEAILSFQEIQDLLAAGKVDEIPFNRTIPEVISEEQPSESSVAPRKKPWEVSTDS